MAKNNRGGVWDGCFICRYEKRKLLLIIRNYYIGKYCVTAKLYAIFIFPSQLTSRILYLGLFAKHIFCSNVFVYFCNESRVLHRVHQRSRKIFDETQLFETRFPTNKHLLIEIQVFETPQVRGGKIVLLPDIDVIFLSACRKRGSIGARIPLVNPIAPHSGRSTPYIPSSDEADARTQIRVNE